tara:strand:- start:3 stop:428 length:426 start_codon:yes stop_codon:yes gene_type:complete
MKITRTQLKKILVEEFTNQMTDEQWIAKNRLDINKLYGEVRTVRSEYQEEVQRLELKLNDMIATGEEKPSRFADSSEEGVQALRSKPKKPSSYQPGVPAGPSTDTNPGGMRETKYTKSQLKQIVYEELKNIFKEKYEISKT